MKISVKNKEKKFIKENDKLKEFINDRPSK